MNKEPQVKKLSEFGDVYWCRIFIVAIPLSEKIQEDALSTSLRWGIFIVA